MEEGLERIKAKARFFYSKQNRAHVKVKPTGGFDCYFISDLIDDGYYKIHKINPYTGEKSEGGEDELFLFDIFDIKLFERRTGV
jgi:hypothetical protein